MKKIFTIILSSLCLFGANVNAQNYVPTDTAGITAGSQPIFAPNGLAVNMRYAGGGFVFGTTWDPNNNFVGIAQGYVNYDTVTVLGGLALVADKFKGPNNEADSKVIWRTYGIFEDAAIVNSVEPSVKPGPGAPVEEVYQLFEELDTTDRTYHAFMFPNPVTYSTDFAIGADFSIVKSKGDTVGILSDAPGDAAGLDYAFHQIDFPSQGAYWFVSTSLINQDNNIALFAILGEEERSIEEVRFFNNMKAFASPNPTTDLLNISFESNVAGKYAIEIITIDGRIITRRELGYKNAGTQYSEQFNVSDLAAGNYLYSLISEKGARYIKQFVVSK